jgi:asparagine synthase (glutamine-hydrolysing)
MCGIAGFTRPGPDARGVVAAMNRALAHRGPDGDGIFVDGDIALGHTRLAVIDPKGGAQPRVDARTGDALVFNGEIYGYLRLADQLRSYGVLLRDASDTEVLFQLIRCYGVLGAMARVDGMFAFAYRDGRTGRLSLVRDRFGEKPLYYGLAGERLVFASETAALRAHPDFAAVAPDRRAAWALMQFEYLPPGLSGWEGIEQLEPATILTFADGKGSLQRYWGPVVGSRRNAKESQAVERVDFLLRDSVRRRVIADVPLGVFLSGGLDSSLVTALAARQVPDLTALSVRIAGSGFDETPYAVDVARHLGVKHEVVEFADTDLLDAVDAITVGLGEPLADSSLLPAWLVCHAARQRMTVALGGDGADELFAGYPNFAVQRFAPLMQNLPRLLGRLAGRAAEAVPGSGGYMNWRFLLRQLSQGFGAVPTRQSYLWMAPFAPADIPRLWRREAVPPAAAEAAFATFDLIAAEAEGLAPVDALLHQFLLTYLPDDILMKSDRASMLNSLELRSPFLDRAVAEYAISLPTSMKLQGRVRKHLLKQVALRYLPAEIVHRKKHGFAVPIGALIRTLLRTRVRDVLTSRSNPAADWFEPAAIARLLAAHESGRRDHGKKLWTLYVLFATAGRAAAAPHLAAAAAAA